MGILEIIVEETNKLINEVSFHNISDKEILTDKYVKDFIGSDDSYLDYFIEENDLDEDDMDEIKSSLDYFEFIKNLLSEKLEEARENIYDKIDYNSNKIILYRAISVDDNWLQHLKTQGKRLGIYWSWDEDGAEPHWGYSQSKNNLAIIEAEIDEKYVDWKTTLEMNMSPNYSDEKEIRLFKNTPIKIRSIKIEGNDVDLSTLGNKTFIA